MQIRVSLSTLRKFQPKLIPSYYSQKPDYNTLIDIPDALSLDISLLEKFKDEMVKEAERKDLPGIVSAITEIRRVIRYKSQPDAGTRSITTLEVFIATFKETIEKTSPVRHWVFREMEDGYFSPAYVGAIEHVRGSRDCRAHVNVTLGWAHAGEQRTTTVSFYVNDFFASGDDESLFDDSCDLEGDGEDDDGSDGEASKTTSKKRKKSLTIAQILTRKQLLLETPELFTAYKQQIPKYVQYRGKTGQVFICTGVGLYRGTESYTSSVTASSLDMDGEVVEFVLDDSNEEKVEFRNTYRFWSYKSTALTAGLWGDKPIHLPISLYLLFFDLKRHAHVWVHIEGASPKVFEKGAYDKLVLPARDKQFITILMKSANLKLNDIIQGKSGGVFSLAEGKPGTGKTLTAEIVAENMGRALYKVQCAQLGISPETIENKLSVVLKRASRWGAVLLMDEADVYIRARDTDIQHNAIVGVMLRVIEYYKGILFMTTNLPNIDDAIISRATAHFRYHPPGEKLLPKIWAVLAKSHGMNLSTSDINQLVSMWPNIVGRDVKNMIRLAMMSANATGEPATVDTIETVSQFLDVGEPARG